MKEELGGVHHLWDGWHFVEWFGNNLRKEAKYKNCAPLAVWYEKLKTHIWKTIEVGEGEIIRHIFNTCLKHVQDVHVWTKVSSVSHMLQRSDGPLDQVRPCTFGRCCGTETRDHHEGGSCV
ncbi:hypothetical protein ANCDUO_18590 [Ancylostoma duodenale]|uniref:Uncharacterized protein n=1 Tax=Ancylostoma duodenale TaxID=51022 RepID=A0A0C2FRX8_9BILA|nr:hypothetical protein ANCDUO_18590 [Ancylostoma duodenale]